MPRRNLKILEGGILIIMKKFKKAASASLAVIMGAGLILSGCGSDNGSAGSTGTPADNTDNTVADPVDGADNGSAAGISLPLTEEKQTLTVWTRNDVALMNVSGGDLNSTPFFQELEERTNVHIEWSIPASGSEQEQFNLLFTSGELPDIMYNIGYIDGLDAAVDDGYILDLTPYLEEYAPNYMAAVKNASPDVQKLVKTDSGRYACIQTIFQTAEPPWFGLMVRQDWLDELGLDKPVTVDDWEEMLTAFKEKKGISAPLSLASNGNCILYMGTGLGLYGADFADGWYQTDGKAKYFFYSDPEAGRDTLTMLNRWYSNGLIDPDFTTADMYGDSVLVNNGKTGAFNSIYTYPSTLFSSATQEGARFTAVLPPVRNEGDTMNYRTADQVFGAAMIISADCENPELAVRWLDYLFSEEGALLANYGIEGETFTMVDGKPQFTDLVANNPDGLSFDEALRYYTMAPGLPSVYSDWTRELNNVPEEAVTMMNDWGVPGTSYRFPDGATMSADENREYSNIFTDLKTYVTESVLAFITGNKSLDEYDSFIETIGKYDIERCIEIKQAALDRYNAR